MIPFDNLYFTIIYTLSGFAQGFVYGYFLHSYLEPKYGKKSFLYFYLSFIFYIAVILFVLYRDPYGRIFFTIIYLTLCGFAFYKGEKAKLLLTGIFLYIVSGIAEVLSQFIIVFIFQYNIFESLPPLLLVFILIMATIFMFLIENAFLKFTRNNFNFNNKFSNILICLSLNNLMIIIVLSIGSYFNGLLSSHTFKDFFGKSVFIICICLILTIMLIRYMIHSLSDLKLSLSKELLIQSIYQQNIEQLEQYLDNRNQQYSISELRHDIMNYLQTIYTLKESKKNE